MDGGMNYFLARDWGYQIDPVKVQAQRMKWLRMDTARDLHCVKGGKWLPIREFINSKVGNQCK